MRIRASSVAPYLCILLIAAAALWGHSQRGPSARDLEACQSNMKSLGTALEMYSSDQYGLYPKTLSQLTPMYLSTLPTCPAAGRDTYSWTYRRSLDPDAYLFWCAGGDHGEGVIPGYDSIQGRILTPKDLEWAKKTTGLDYGGPPPPENVQWLQSDLRAMQSKSQVTPAQKQQLATDLMALADGTTKPSQASVQKLASDLADAMLDSNLGQREGYVQLMIHNVRLVMRSAHLPQSEVQTAIADAKWIFLDQGVTLAETQTLVTDLRAITAELEANVPASGSPAPRP